MPDVDADTVRRTCSRMADAGQLTRDAGGRYFPDTGSRTAATPETSALSDCPADPAEQRELPGHLEEELSGLSGPDTLRRTS
ncbi:hypothetical protein ACIQCJ_02670 [Streptomyces sp. NPDC093221]|uniref:hypothetical protein n=1 Tax=Streptomyces sp. NPDC093221 TaxID=3366032 RepID=UPI00382F3A3A